MRKVLLPVYLAVFGGLLLLGSIVFSAVAYNGTYSCFNHFISELGWPQRSPLAWLYNGALTISSLLFAPLIVSLAVALRARWAAAFGLVSILAAAALGFLPLMHHLAAHLRVAFLFFVGWGLTALLFSLAFWRTRPPARFMIVLGLVAFGIATAFLIYPKGDLPSVLKLLRGSNRPAFWWPAILEWLVLISCYLWGLGAIFFLSGQEAEMCPPKKVLS